MNRVNLVGRLSNDIELKTTQSGKYVVSFTVAINKFGDGADFIPCVAWNKSAEFLSNYAKKGNRVSVDGRLSQRTYETKDGQNRSVLEVVVDQVELLESKSSESKPKVVDVEFDTGPLIEIEDDMPF